ncbi:MAG: monovalent cation/H+ antiporter subunit D family protein [Arenicella sp.]
MLLIQFIQQHLPALQIILPMLFAPVCVMLRRGNTAWLITVLVSALCLLNGVMLLQQVQDGSVIRYALGGWQAPTGIEYFIDLSNTLLIILVSTVSLLAAIYSKSSLIKDISPEKHYLFYAGWLLCLTGMLGILITGDAFNVFVFLEISSLSTYMLIALGKERPHSYIAAFRYLIMGSIGASFILLGIGFLYAATGTLNMHDLATRLPAVAESRTVVVGFSFITIGVLIKAAIFPLHAWLPSAYQYAPSAVTCFLAGTATKVSLYVLVRFFFHIFGVDFSFVQLILGYVLLPAAIVGFVVMSIVAVFQNDLRRLLAFSSIAQIGYILAGICILSVTGVSAALMHIINHGLIKSALFMATGSIIFAVGTSKIQSMPQLLHRMPYTISAFTIAGVSLIGVPLTAGFVSKWNLIQASLEKGWWPIVVLILFSSLMAVLYIGKVVLVTCFNQSNTDTSATDSTITEVPASMTIATWALIGISLYFGINAETFVGITGTAAEQLIRGIR